MFIKFLNILTINSKRENGTGIFTWDLLFLFGIVPFTCNKIKILINIKIIKYLKITLPSSQINHLSMSGLLLGYKSEALCKLLLKNNLKDAEKILNQYPGLVYVPGYKGIYTPLSTVAKYGNNTNIATWLINKYNAPIEKKDRGKTPLMHACGRILYPGANMVEILLKCKANPNQQDDKNENTPLMIACKFECEESIQIVKWLLWYESNIYLQNKINMTIIEQVETSEYKKFIKLFNKL